jgi:uncharacterized membrane protein
MEGFETVWTLGLEFAARAIEFVAALILIFGAVRFTMLIAGELLARGNPEGGIFRRARVSLGGYILAALEFLIVADILFTILRRTLDELYILAILTAIRTALSWFLTRELHELRRDEQAKAAAG